MNTKQRLTWRLYGVGVERIARELPLRAKLLGRLLDVSAAALMIGTAVMAATGVPLRTLFWTSLEPSLYLVLTSWCVWRRRTAWGTTLLLVGLSHTAAFTMGHYGLHHFSAVLPALTILACGLLIGAYFVLTWTAVCAGMVWLIASKTGEGWHIALGWTATYVAVAFLVILFSRYLEALVAANSAAEEAERAAVVAERTRFAREIHDTLAQGFTGIVVQLNAAEERLDADPAGARGHLEKARALARQSLDEARRSVMALRPGGLAGGADLLSAIDQIGQELTSGSDIRFAARRDGEPYALSDETATQLLRIGQEALTNAVRHGGASHIELCLRYLPGRALLEVSDDGGGIPEMARGGGGGGFGLGNMAARARQLGGELTVQSERGRGTRIVASVPSR